MLFILILCIISFISFGIFVIYQINILGNVIDDIYRRPLQMSSASNEARVEIIKIQRNVLEIILAKSASEIKTRLENTSGKEKLLSEHLNVISNNAKFETTRQTVSEIRKTLANWSKTRQQITNLCSVGKNDKALSISKVTSDAQVNDLQEKLNMLDNVLLQVANQLTLDAVKIENQQKMTLAITITILVVTLLALFISVIKSILSPLLSLQHAMNTSASTGELTESYLSGENEIVDMSHHYNILIKKLKEQFWIKDGQNQLNQELLGNLPLEELTQKSINYLARSIEAGHGVFYLFDKGAKLLSLSASFALTDLDQSAYSLALGERVVGQVALERKSILLTGITKQESLISTGIINEAPLSTYVFPLLFEDKLLGVIELSSFKEIDKLNQEFLNETTDIVTNYLYSAIQNAKIKKLLEFSEAAQLEARNSADELKKANEVLEEQQSLLQQQTEELQNTNAQLEEQHQILQQQTEELQNTNAQLEEQQQLLQQQSEELQQTNTQLEEQQQQLKEQSKLLNIKNQDLEKSQSELIERTTELELANKYKSEFLANMSHELRTPLNSIILLSKLLSRNKKSELKETTLEKVNVIYHSGQELLRLINDILDLTKIEAGRMDLNKIKFHTTEMITELNQMFEGMA